MRTFAAVLVLGTILGASGCAKQPSELVKASIEKQLPFCTFAVNPSSSDGESDMADAIMRLASLADANISNKSWRTDDTESNVTATFDSEETEFSCDYVKGEDGEWEISKARRNGEEVYDAAVAKQLEAKFKAEKEAREAEELLVKRATWTERGFSNVDYKYYEKHSQQWEGGYSGPTVEVVCDPEGAYVKYDDGTVRFGDRPDVDFTVIKKNGEETVVTMDLTSSGAFGEKRQTSIGEQVYRTDDASTAAINMLKSATEISVGASTFRMDDLSQIPCI